MVSAYYLRARTGIGVPVPTVAASHLKAPGERGHHNQTAGYLCGINISPSVFRKELVVNLNSIVKVKLNEVFNHLEKQHEENRMRYPGIFRSVCTVGDRRKWLLVTTRGAFMSDLGTALLLRRGSLELKRFGG